MRKVPPVLALSISIAMFTSLLEIVWPESDSMRRTVATSALWFTTHALFVAGALELARGLAGAARVGARIAAYAMVVAILSSVWWGWMPVLWRSAPWELLVKVWSWVWLALTVAAAIGLAIPAWRRRRLAIIGLAVALVADLSQIAMGPLLEWLGGGMSTFYRVQALRTLLEFSGLAVLAIAASGESTAADARRAAAGLRRLGGALRARVVAKLVVAGITLMLVASSGANEGSFALLRLAMMSGAIIEILAQLFGCAGVASATGAHVADLPRWPLAFAAAGMAWCAGVMIHQLPSLYGTLYRDGPSGSGDVVQALSNIMPIVVTASVATVAAVIGILARRRGDNQLGEHASGKGVGFVALMLSSIGITAWVIEHAGSPGGLAIMILCAAAAAIFGQLMMAKLCHLGADALEAEPGLPTAQVV